VCKALLAVLAHLGDVGLAENPLMVETEIRAGRPVTTAAFRDALQHGRNKGWIGHRVDTVWGDDVYWITKAGLNLLAGI
jgi:hypothetical protein